MSFTDRSSGRRRRAPLTRSLRMRGPVAWMTLVACLAAHDAAAQVRRGVAGKRADFTACADVIQTAASPLSVHAPLLRYTITSFDPNWFNPETAQQGTPLFTLRIAPQLSAYADRLSLGVRVRADTNFNGNPLAAPLEVFDRTSGNLNASLVGVPLTSGTVFGLDFQGGTDFRNSDFYHLVTSRRDVPPLNLRFEFSLYCSGVPVAENGVAVRFESTAKLRYVRQVRALSPGTDVAGARPASIYTRTPVFHVSSDLLNANVFEYAPDERRLEIFVYELTDGQEPRDAFRGLEHARFSADRFPVLYPPDQPELIPGRRYAWRVRALLRGPESRYSYSNALYFLVDERLAGGASADQEAPTILSEPSSGPGQIRYGDDHAKRTLAALKAILGPNDDAVATGAAGGLTPAPGLIRLNGQPLSLEELEKLAREFRAVRQRVTRIKFE